MVGTHKRTFLVTGGSGFIGSSFVLQSVMSGHARCVNLDKLTYAGNPLNLEALADHPDYTFFRGDLGDRDLTNGIFRDFQPDAVVNFAAESHVDRSIHDPGVFIGTNVVGTWNLLDETLRYWERLDGERREGFRFLHVSTDEVYGSLGPQDPPFHEGTPYDPSSPYSASKAAADHLVRACHRTYGLPVLITNCSNNYGPRQFPEKLIPLTILNAFQGKPLPLYGDGLNVRDWLYVEDHCAALRTVLERGRVGHTYNIGGRCERTNLDTVTTLCRLMDELFPESPHRPHESLMAFVKDRPGHDRRYAVDCSKIREELGWTPSESFESGLRKTILWYRANGPWVKSVQSGAYRRWIERHYGFH
ncbi:MAG TPA: dTDP-glucose 4,6-dehydratase [Syntrophobacteraceae bacterium]|nr:dTDP-glucose 4,6-dehydratase [Syntrophobacteraceae bacterium]